jgi:Transposase DDE domain
VADDAPPVPDPDCRQWRLIRDFRARLGALAPDRPPHPSWQDPKRQLQQLDYLSLFLFGLVNPALKTMRSLCAASRTRRVQEEVGLRPTSPGSFSEAQHLLDPRLLEELIASLTAEVSGPPPADPHQAWPLWLARDSSIFPALSRMVWAQYGCGKPGRPNHAVRLHVSFHLWEDKPVQVAVTPGRVCERRVWREQLRPGATYVGDRYFAEDYKMLARLEEQGCHFVLRLRDEAVFQPATENPVPPAAAAAGVGSDAWGELGCRARHRTGRVRVVTLRKPGGTVRLVTNFPLAQMSARDVQVLYRRRWQIECFFRWLKCLLGCRHWLAESPKGVATQLYLAVIAGLMLQLVLGRRPNRRLWEMLQLYLLGWATLEELMRAVAQAQALAVKKS